MAEPSQLSLLSETKLDPRAHAGLLTCNPSIELFARAAGAKSLQICRTNGQSVVKSSQKGDKDSVVALTWKADGQFLAVGWSDGVVRLLGLESSKAVHQIPVGDGQSKITCIGWARTRAGRQIPSSSSTTTQGVPLLQGLSLGADGAKDQSSKLDLPRELTFLEVETSLPLISPLPASGGSGDDMFVFTTRASLEYLFKPFSPQDSDQVDVMIVGTSDTQIHLSIYDSFVIGTFAYSLPRSFGENASLELFRHASHPDLSSHTLVFKSVAEQKPNALYLVPMDLTFVYSSPENLSLLASKATTLQKLLRYVKQVQMHLVHEWQTTRELPGKFLSLINDSLREAGTYGEMDIVQAMYHSVVTGHTFPEVKEWLVDQLAERGHKRWDKAVISGLENLRSLVHENLLPVLERIAIILSRLLGIARFHDSQDQIGFTSAQITNVMDTVSCTMLVGNKILLLVMEELELFRAFSGWLRHEIDRFVSSGNDDLTDKEAHMDHGKILAYIQHHMQASPLKPYLGVMDEKILERDTKVADSGSSLLELLDKQLKKQDSGEESVGVFSHIEFLCTHLTKKTETVFKGIADAEKRSVRFGQPIKIQLRRSISQIDVCLSSLAEKDAQLGVVFAAITQEGIDDTVMLFRTETTIVNGISGSVAAQVTAMVFEEAKVLDVKFLNDHLLLVLLLYKDQLRLVGIPHQTSRLGYTEYKNVDTVEPYRLTMEQARDAFTSVDIAVEGGFRPTQMEVRQASTERGHIQARVCLLGEDLETYRVYPLPDAFKSTAVRSD